ncbi:hypothetical protein C8R45DRAFT_1185068 [Mycena sanguinolenta]|nr:hypothetical protein C8R45DRAFT_1185068 [Mycena sanguinolenta]
MGKAKAAREGERAQRGVRGKRATKSATPLFVPIPHPIFALAAVGKRRAYLDLDAAARAPPRERRLASSTSVERRGGMHLQLQVSMAALDGAESGLWPGRGGEGRGGEGDHREDGERGACRARPPRAKGECGEEMASSILRRYRGVAVRVHGRHALRDIAHPYPHVLCTSPRLTNRETVQTCDDDSAQETSRSMRTITPSSPRPPICRSSIHMHRPSPRKTSKRRRKSTYGQSERAPGQGIKMAHKLSPPRKGTIVKMGFRRAHPPDWILGTEIEHRPPGGSWLAFVLPVKLSERDLWAEGALVWRGEESLAQHCRGYGRGEWVRTLSHHRPGDASRSDAFLPLGVRRRTCEWYRLECKRIWTSARREGALDLSDSASSTFQIRDSGRVLWDFTRACTGVPSPSQQRQIPLPGSQAGRSSVEGGTLGVEGHNKCFGVGLRCGRWIRARAERRDASAGSTDANNDADAQCRLESTVILWLGLREKRRRDDVPATRYTQHTCSEQKKNANGLARATVIEICIRDQWLRKRLLSGTRQREFGVFPKRKRAGAPLRLSTSPSMSKLNAADLRVANLDATRLDNSGNLKGLEVSRTYCWAPSRLRVAKLPQIKTVVVLGGVSLSW